MDGSHFSANVLSVSRKRRSLTNPNGMLSHLGLMFNHLELDQLEVQPPMIFTPYDVYPLMGKHYLDDYQLVSTHTINFSFLCKKGRYSLKYTKEGLKFGINGVDSTWVGFNWVIFQMVKLQRW